MKNLYYTLLAIAISVSVYSCSSGHNSSITISYSGRTVFAPDGEEIAAISPNGFFTFGANGRQIDVKADAKGILSYQISNGDKTMKPTAEETSIIIEAYKYCKANGLITPKPPYVLEEKGDK